ncbi:MAG: hypothetical protein COA94_05615 [Rickettsiales bacterium]|nr:MAG: hypothetical protein COA94_05615 [Rickettsiales bacterium]
MLDSQLIAIVEKIKTAAQKGVTISAAESCTGGMLAAYLTAISGSSKYFHGGIVSYSNSAKINLLSVNVGTLEKFGAVSEETAREMATGARKVLASDLAISITGIAGDTGGTRDKPIGMVCFAIANNEGVQSYTHHFTGDRTEVRQQACKIALELLLAKMTRI